MLQHFIIINAQQHHKRSTQRTLTHDANSYLFKKWNEYDKVVIIAAEVHATYAQIVQKRVNV